MPFKIAVYAADMKGPTTAAAAQLAAASTTRFTKAIAGPRLTTRRGPTGFAPWPGLPSRDLHEVSVAAVRHLSGAPQPLHSLTPGPIDGRRRLAERLVVLAARPPVALGLAPPAACAVRPLPSLVAAHVGLPGLGGHP